MYGTNPLTGQCVYSTPCGWCVKFDKKCDKKIPIQKKSTKWYEMCVLYKDGKCMGTKETDNCLEDKCEYNR